MAVLVRHVLNYRAVRVRFRAALVADRGIVQKDELALRPRCGPPLARMTERNMALLPDCDHPLAASTVGTLAVVLMTCAADEFPPADVDSGSRQSTSERGARC